MKAPKFVWAGYSSPTRQASRPFDSRAPLGRSGQALSHVNLRVPHPTRFSLGGDFPYCPKTSSQFDSNVEGAPLLVVFEKWGFLSLILSTELHGCPTFRGFRKVGNFHPSFGRSELIIQVCQRRLQHLPVRRIARDL